MQYITTRAADYLFRRCSERWYLLMLVDDRDDFSRETYFSRLLTNRFASRFLGFSGDTFLEYNTRSPSYALLFHRRK